jgi:hypothetical protein
MYGHSPDKTRGVNPGDRGWKIGPSHYLNQDLGTVWLAPPQCGECSAAPPNGEKHVEATGK